MSECSSPISPDCASESTRSSGSPSSFDEPEVYAALRAAAEVLESLGGATVVEVQVPYYEELCSAARITSRSESFAYHADDLAARWDDYFRSTRRGVSGGAFYTAAEYVQAQRVRRVVQRALTELYTTVDLVITPPTATVSAFLMDSLDSLQGGAFRGAEDELLERLGQPGAVGADGGSRRLVCRSECRSSAAISRMGPCSASATHISVEPPGTNAFPAGNSSLPHRRNDMPETRTLAGTAEKIAVLAAVAGLDLTPERIDALKASVEDMWQAAARVRAVDLGEVAPAAAFDPEWV